MTLGLIKKLSSGSSAFKDGESVGCYIDEAIHHHVLSTLYHSNISTPLYLDIYKFIYNSIRIGKRVHIMLRILSLPVVHM